ncbi:hypothetical protein EVAR_21089_1 [Eumeta japonica]|uniref:Uncharacterized protein n=1 Tax=Eumeta variegata TaxID=151549 RepID=A0A4C1V006_EUMVA|nr:hypothetical protein EVAR_21089_1 [Eumeta japonica]
MRVLVYVCLCVCYYELHLDTKVRGRSRSARRCAQWVCQNDAIRAWTAHYVVAERNRPCVVAADDQCKSTHTRDTLAGDGGAPTLRGRYVPEEDIVQRIRNYEDRHRDDDGGDPGLRLCSVCEVSNTNGACAHITNIMPLLRQSQRDANASLRPHRPTHPPLGIADHRAVVCAFVINISHRNHCLRIYRVSRTCDTHHRCAAIIGLQACARAGGRRGVRGPAGGAAPTPAGARRLPKENWLDSRAYNFYFAFIKAVNHRRAA